MRIHTDLNQKQSSTTFQNRQILIKMETKHTIHILGEINICTYMIMICTIRGN